MYDKILLDQWSKSSFDPAILLQGISLKISSQKKKKKDISVKALETI